MATSPCGIDTGLADIQAAQESLTDLLGPGSKDTLAAIKVQTDAISAKLSSFKPEIELNPNLQTRLQALSASPSPAASLGIMVEIQNTFGPVVEDLGEILNEVSPELKTISDLVQSSFSGGTGSVTDLLNGENATALLQASSGLKTISPATVCEKCRNIEVKTLEDGTKIAQELPNPPTVPQAVPVAEPIKAAQSLSSQNDMSAALLAFQEAQNYARDRLLNEFKERGFPPTISEQQHAINGNRYFSHYTFIYMKYAEIVGLDADPTLWIRRADPWVELQYARDTNYIGEPTIDEDRLYNDEIEYFANAYRGSVTYDEVVQKLYDITPEEARVVFDGTTANSFLKEI